MRSPLAQEVRLGRSPRAARQTRALRAPSPAWDTSLPRHINPVHHPAHQGTIVQTQTQARLLESRHAGQRVGALNGAVDLTGMSMESATSC
jgi:hypothetical protein